MGTDMRRRLTFDCAGAMLAGSLDSGDACTGLLIVSGGNEILAGAHRGMASLAAHIATLGYPVFRFDRRGVGDSEGHNGGYRSSADDIAAAIAAFRHACPHVSHIVGFGNCDAASALVLHQATTRADALILANPWLLDDAPDDEDDEADDVVNATDATAMPPALPPASAIRARYIAKLKDPREWLRLLRGGVDVRKLLRGLRAARGGAEHSAAAVDLATAMRAIDVPVTILIADRDRTAQAFVEQWGLPPFAESRTRMTMQRVDSGSHSFADALSRRWLVDHIANMLSAVDAQAR